MRPKKLSPKMKKYVARLCHTDRKTITKRPFKLNKFRPNWDKKNGYVFPAELSNEWYAEQYPEIYKENT